MEHGPLPPHERTWRHPSELAAEEHGRARTETAGGSTRAFAFASGSLGLLAVGLLMVAVTPDRSVAPLTISATTTPSERTTQIAVAASSAPSGVTDLGPVALRGRPEALATPVEEGRLAIVTAADLAATGELSHVGAAVEVAVPSGRLADAVVVAHGRDTVLVQLDRPEPGLTLADEQPAGHDIVTVMAEPPVTVVLDDLASLEVEEGTAVLDGTGELVGLCSQDRNEATRLIPVGDVVATGGDGGSRPGDGGEPVGEHLDDRPVEQPDEEGPPAGGPISEQPDEGGPPAGGPISEQPDEEGPPAGGPISEQPVVATSDR